MFKIKKSLFGGIQNDFKFFIVFICSKCRALKSTSFYLDAFLKFENFKNDFKLET